MHTIIIGLGSMGIAAASALAKRGHHVTGFDQFDVPNTQASHHGSSRVFRVAYFEHPNYVPLLQQAHEGWRKLERDAGANLLEQIGGLYAGERDGAFISGTREAAARYDLDIELLDATEAMARYPMFKLPENYHAIYESAAGLLRPEDSITAFRTQAEQHGAALHTNTRIDDWNINEDGSVTVHASGTSYHADRLILTAGPWATNILKNQNLPLTTTRQVLAWIQPDNEDIFHKECFPIWGVVHENNMLHYGFPVLPPRAGAKIAIHFPGALTNADEVDRLAQPSEIEALKQVVARTIPGLGDKMLKTCVCMYCNTPDGHPIIDRRGPLTYACGFSGHGFKFASVIGEALADLAIDGATKRPIDFLGAGRFSPNGQKSGPDQ